MYPQWFGRAEFLDVLGVGHVADHAWIVPAPCRGVVGHPYENTVFSFTYQTCMVVDAFVVVYPSLVVEPLAVLCVTFGMPLLRALEDFSEPGLVAP